MPVDRHALRELRDAPWRSIDDLRAYVERVGALERRDVDALLKVLLDPKLEHGPQHKNRCSAFKTLCLASPQPTFFEPITVALERADPTLRRAMVAVLPKVNDVARHEQLCACLRTLGRPTEALFEILRVDTSGPTYRKACFDLIAIAKETDRLEFDVDRFLTRFVQEGPADPDEIPTFVDLAQLYFAKGFSEGAKRCLRKVLESDPDHAGARDLDARLRRARRARRSSPPRVAGAPATARGLPPLPSLEAYVALAREHAPERES